MSRTSETPAPDSPDLRCKCGKCLAKDGSIKCSRCDVVTDVRPRLLDEARHTAFYLSALATTSQLLGSNEPPVKITIVPGNQHNGYVHFQPSEAPVHTVEDLKRQLVVLLSGRAAENTLGSPTTGSTNTMQRAIELARRIVSYGMVKDWDKNPEQAAMTLLDDAWKEAEAFVAANRAAIDSVAAMLLFKGELTGDDVARLTARLGATNGGAAKE
jgi:ATP-dependent Zn protease